PGGSLSRRRNNGMQEGFHSRSPDAPGRRLRFQGRLPLDTATTRGVTFMMKRIVLAAAIAALGITVVAAQSDPIAARKAMMKSNGQAAGQGAKFMKGEEPFDLAKAQAIFATYQKAAGEFGKLFPDNSKTGGETAALPAVWENKADFDAKLVKF